MSKEFILLFLILNVMILSVYVAKILIKKYSETRRKVKEFIRMEENKCKGPHKWFEMEIEDQKTHVCRDCCWCPHHDSFIKEFYVKIAVFESDHEKHLEEGLKKLSSEYEIDVEKLKEINSKITQISSDFSKAYLEERLESLKEKQNK